MVADVAYAHLSLSGTYQGGDWPDAGWLAAQYLVLLAGLAQLRRPAAAPPAPGTAALQRVSRLPYGAAAAGYVLLLVVGRNQADYPLDGLLVGAMLLTVVVMIRQLGVIGENMRLVHQLHHMAAHDPLTGLHNRRSFFDLAEQCFERAGRVARPMAALMIDVDHFKAINDSHGHATGDQVLATVALRIGEQVRAGDLVGRYGGDELVVVLPDCDVARAGDAADRIRLAVNGSPVLTEAGLAAVTLSIGVADSSACSDLSTLLRNADAALYEAKRAGRACTRTHALTGIGNAGGR
jgi:diguanylate cyclase (GGDEF)-like protein